MHKMSLSPQVNFRIDTKLLLVLIFQDATIQFEIHFHPGHPQLKTLSDSLDTLI